MRIATLYGPHDFRIEQQPSPEFKPDECLIRVRACGVCHSELHQWERAVTGLTYPRWIGHEVSGEIIKIGSQVKNFKPGDRVAVWVDQRGYAEEIVAKEDRIFPIASAIPFDQALAEPIACTTNGVQRANIQMGDIAALVGTGFMGLILLQQIKLRGTDKIIAIDIRDEMLELAMKLGADVVLNPNKKDVGNETKKLTDGTGVDVAFEIGGVQATLDLAAEICRMEGKLVIFGYHPGPRQIHDLGFWNWMAFDIINAHFRNINTILSGARLGMKLLNARKINMTPLITHRFPLEKINDAFHTANQKPKGFVKAVITMN
jgi:threonine dehydrogenase-like Zn-dependent dehydrogenase